MCCQSYLEEDIQLLQFIKAKSGVRHDGSNLKMHRTVLALPEAANTQRKTQTKRSQYHTYSSIPRYFTTQHTAQPCDNIVPYHAPLGSVLQRLNDLQPVSEPHLLYGVRAQTAELLRQHRGDRGDHSAAARK